VKKEDVLNLMTELPPDLIEEADLQAPARRRLPAYFVSMKMPFWADQSTRKPRLVPRSRSL